MVAAMIATVLGERHSVESAGVAGLWGRSRNFDRFSASNLGAARAKGNPGG